MKKPFPKKTRPPPGRPTKTEITSPELILILKSFRVTLDCGHHFTLHPLSNTLVITAEGRTYCHNCYQ